VDLEEGEIVVGLTGEEDKLNVAVYVRAAGVVCLVLAVCGLDVRGVR